MNMTFARIPNLTNNPTAKDEIEALATPALKAAWDAYDDEVDKDTLLEAKIVAAGWDLSVTDRPDQWDRVIGWLEDKLEGMA